MLKDTNCSVACQWHNDQFHSILSYISKRMFMVLRSEFNSVTSVMVHQQVSPNPDLSIGKEHSHWLIFIFVQIIKLY